MKTKLPSIKILQAFTRPDKNNVFGLGDDDQIYFYDESERLWKYHDSEEKLEPAVFISQHSAGHYKNQNPGR